MAPGNFKFSLRYASHLAVLIQAVHKTKGPVIEFGAGLSSTPVLHEMLLAADRDLLTFETDNKYWRFFNNYHSSRHTIQEIDSWDNAHFNGDLVHLEDGRWSVALVDHSPGSRRITEIRRLANCADYIVCHDANPSYEKEYQYSQIYPLFKYKLDYQQANPNTVILSNFIPLEGFWNNESA